MPKLHVVQRRAWDVNRHDDEPNTYNGDDDPQGVPVAAFVKKADATKRAKELAAAARRETNPFQFEGGELDALSSLPEKSLLGRLTALGLVPPPAITGHPDRWRNGRRDWITWYDGLASQLTDAERDGVWDLLDLLVLYAVVSVALEE
ncbi:MAG: hypothetical protein ACRC33_03245 [Gemmataceae bacterium]